MRKRTVAVILTLSMSLLMAVSILALTSQAVVSAPRLGTLGVGDIINLETVRGMARSGVENASIHSPSSLNVTLRVVEIGPRAIKLEVLRGSLVLDGHEYAMDEGRVLFGKGVRKGVLVGSATDDAGSEVHFRIVLNAVKLREPGAFLRGGGFLKVDEAGYRVRLLFRVVR